MTLQLRKILREIVDILADQLFLNREEALGIIVPLTTEKKATNMLEYLQKNKDNKELMRIDKLLKTTLKIADED